MPRGRRAGRFHAARLNAGKRPIVCCEPAAPDAAPLAALLLTANTVILLPLLLHCPAFFNHQEVSGYIDLGQRLAADEAGMASVFALQVRPLWVEKDGAGKVLLRCLADLASAHAGQSLTDMRWVCSPPSACRRACCRSPPTSLASIGPPTG